MEKYTRISHMVDLDSYHIIIKLYLEAKNNPIINKNDFIIFRAFLAKMIYAQTEYVNPTTGETVSKYHPYAQKKWRIPCDFFGDMLFKCDEQRFIERMIHSLRNGFKGYGFDITKHNGLMI